MTKKLEIKDFLSGCKLSIPVVAGYLPLGVGCGVILTGAGLTIFQSVFMSLVVYAGAAQYISGGLILAGASAFSIIITVMIINMRHILYTSTLYPHVRQWSHFKKAIFASEITDEAFGILSSEMAKGEVSYSKALGINITAHSGWVIGVGLGAYLGSFIGDYKVLGLDFALPALFIALLTPKLIGKPHIFAAIISGVISLIFAMYGQVWGIIVASVVGASVGYILSRKYSDA